MPEKRKKTIDAAADRQTMTELYETYEQKMFGIANAILHNDWQAEDAVHEAFVRMVPYLSRCKDVNDEKDVYKRQGLYLIVFSGGLQEKQYKFNTKSCLQPDNTMLQWLSMSFNLCPDQGISNRILA